ncbi:MAG TPA: hypothetical protein VE093_43530 [Polyangiaceae bacterium]|jgi:hypothetical protein|nr:hypothetical protein [Polyangiaceae bacterium]
MNVRTLTPRTTLSALRSEVVYSLARLKAHPLAASHAPEFEGLRSQCDTVLTTENTLRDGLAEAEAAIDMRDEVLDDLADRLSAAILAITKNDREHPLYTLYFGNKPLSRFKRPVLGAELEATRAWIPLLTNNKHPSLAALAQELKDAIEAADTTLALAQEHAQKLKEFRSDGALHALVEKTNATRKAACGALAKLPHEQTGLPSDFASQFFRRGPSSENDPEPAPTIEDVTARLAELAKETAEQQALLAELEAQAAEAAAEEDATRAKLAELEMIMANAAKEAAAMKAKLNAMA